MNSKENIQQEIMCLKGWFCLLCDVVVVVVVVIVVIVIIIIIIIIIPTGAFAGISRLFGFSREHLRSPVTDFVGIGLHH